MQTSGTRKQPANDWKRSQENLESHPDIDLKTLWEEAKVNFKNKTNHILKEEDSFNKVLSEQIQAILTVENPNDEDIDEEAKSGIFTKAHLKNGFRRAKALFKKVFEVIWKFSDFLMPMVPSIPFIGSGVTFLKQAIELLITATKNYRAIFVHAGELFEQVGFFSMRFEMLMEAENAGAKLNRKYLQFLNRILAHTVDCAALFIQLTKKSEEGSSTFIRRAKKAAEVSKQFFKTFASGDDAGVKFHMTQLQSLVEEEGKLSTALILATVLKIQTDVVAVRGSVNTISDKLDSVNSMLGEFGTLLSPSKTDQLKAMLCVTSEPWSSRLRACAERRIRGTGEWLLKNELLTAWTTNQAESPQVLAIEAGSSFGKTYLATAAIIHLRERVQNAKGRLTVAFYLFDKSSKKLTAGEVVRSIAYQLCLQDLSFFETAHPIMEQAAGRNGNLNAETTKALWSNLIVDVASRIEGCTFFIVLDGVERMDEGELGILCDALTSSSTAVQSLRILLTGDAASLAVISKRSGLSFAKIALDQTYPNRQDVALVTEACLASCDLFLGRNASTDLLKYKSDVCDRLVQAVSGDYYLLDSRIRDIRHLLSLGEIEQALSRVNERRQDTIIYQLSNLAVRLSAQELSQLKGTLHLLAVLEFIGAPMPHISVVEQYLAENDASPGLIMTNIQSAYSSLLIIDDQGHVSLATSEITTYLIERKAPKGTNAMPQFSQGKQLDAIQHFLSATFNSKALEANGFDNNFFNSRHRLSSVSQFSGKADLIVANVTIRLVASLVVALSAKDEGDFEKKERALKLASFARGVLPELLLQLDLTNVDEDVIKDLGIAVAGLFLDQDILDAFWPVEALAQVRATWGTNDRYFDALFRIVKHPAVTKHVENHEQQYPWVASLHDIKEATHLKLIASRMIATRWFQSNSFWTYTDINLMFHWFTILRKELKLEEKNVVNDSYDKYRTIGWYTPPNWKKIEAWVLDNIQINDQTDLFIQTGAVLVTFGGPDTDRIKLLNPYRDTDWRATVWLSEATSMKDKINEAYALLEQALALIVERKPERETAVKAINTLHGWAGGWNDLQKNMRISENIMALDETFPGLLSYEMISVTLEVAVQTRGPAGFDFFQSMYQSKKQILLETFVHYISHNYAHIALSRTIADDVDGLRIRTFREVYQQAIALCDSSKDLSPRDRKITKLKLSFWLARLLFIGKGQSNIQEAIAIWEDLIKEFSLNPTVADLENIIPIATHMCSAYIHTALQDPASSETERIISQVRGLREIARFSQDPLALKLGFRLSLCLARIYVARDALTEAQDVLSEHAASAFTMISQRNNKPLASIGWMYLASILTVLGHDSASWAWTKVQLHQPDRWFSFTGYANASNSEKNPPLAEDLRAKLGAIKKGEEFTFWDGPDHNAITSIRPDDRYLPSYASMACDGRNCRSASDDVNEAVATHNDALQIPSQYTNRGGHFTSAQNAYGWCNGYWQRVPFWVCRDCMCKLCVTCGTRLLNDELPSMGCRPYHDGVNVLASTGEGDPYAVYDEEMAWVDEEKKRWNIDN